MKKNKKIQILVGTTIMLLIIFLSTVLFVLKNDITSNEKFQTPNTINNLSEAREIIESGDSVLIYFSQRHCSYCKELDKFLNNLNSDLKENIYLYYIENEDKDQIKTEFDFTYTPTLVFYKNSKEVDRLNNELIFETDEPKIVSSGENELRKWLKTIKEVN